VELKVLNQIKLQPSYKTKRPKQQLYKNQTHTDTTKPNETKTWFRRLRKQIGPIL